MNKKKKKVARVHCILIAISMIIGMKTNCAKSMDALEASSMKKKIVILTSFGGGGNKSASIAMESYLKKDYDVVQCEAFKEILAPLDPFSFLTFNTYSSEQVYNAFVPGKYFLFLGWLYGIGRWYIQSQKEKIHVLFHDYFTTTKPKLIISVIPIINNIVLEVAQEMNIPFILAPTDLDVDPYIINITKPTHSNFYVCLPFTDEDILKPIQKTEISPDHIRIIGAPLKPSFFIHKDKGLLQHYKIDGAKPTIMVLMGSLGSDDIKLYASQLLLVEKPCNLLMLIGSNEVSRQDLAELSVPDHITMHIIGRTDFIADYMALSDLLITKSGTMSVCEALYMDLPLFLDATSTLLPWEKFNHHFIKKHVFGLSVGAYSDISGLVNNALKNPDELKLYKDNIRKLEKKDFAQEFLSMVGQILDSN